MSNTEPSDTEATRAARAAQIHEQIDDIIDAARKKEPHHAPAHPPQNPREFIDQQTADESAEPEDNDKPADFAG